MSPRATLWAAWIIAAVGLTGGASCGGTTGPTPAGQVVITGGPTELRQGDVGVYEAEVRSAAGSALPAHPVEWSVVPATAGFVTPEGRLVAYEPGTVRLAASAVGSAAAAADTVEIEVSPREGLSGTFTVVGHGPQTDRFTSDLWVHEDVAYTGTWGIRQGPGGSGQGDSLRGDRLYAWDVADPGALARTDSVSVDAVTVNDVKVDPAGLLAVMTHEGSTDGQNGITLLDSSDPHHPREIVRFTERLEAGVHNLWVEGGYLYAVSDGVRPESGSGMQVIDVSDPEHPSIVAHFFGGTPGNPGDFLHDIYVRDGLAFLSHWNVGLVIMDVGNGILGGSPENPVEVSRIMPRAAPGSENPSNQVHNAWYWPEAGYVFVGEEDFTTPGRMHVVDVRDLREPRYVASYRPLDHQTTPHNFWLDEEREILYMAWYAQGLRALDVAGELLGELERQDREIAAILYGGAGGCPVDQQEAGTCSWAPQLHRGLVFVSDMNSGIWALRPDF